MARCGADDVDVDVDVDVESHAFEMIFEMMTMMMMMTTTNMMMMMMMMIETMIARSNYCFNTQTQPPHNMYPADALQSS